MRFLWPEATEFQRLVLDVEQDDCDHCGRRLHICDHRIRHIYTLEHPLQLCCRLAHCSDSACPSRPHTLSPAAELTLAMPGWLIAWDVFAFIGHRRFARHWSVPAICKELLDTYRIKLSDDSIFNYIHRYQNMVAARQQDLDLLRLAYQDIDAVDLTIDGLQPEKGHETLYAVRELKAKRVWFAEALVSSNEAEVRRLFERANAMAQSLGKPIRLWMSDKQDAFVKGIAAEFPGIPHLYCGNHFLRDLAKPMLAADSHAKVQMRKKVRGLRAIEREVLLQRQQAGAEATPLPQSDPTIPNPARVVEAPVVVVSTPEIEVVQRVTADVEITSEASKTEQTEAGTLPEPVAQTRLEVTLTPDVVADTQATQAGVYPVRTDGPLDKGAVVRADEVVLDYCAAVRGILNDDQGGALHPPGLRMAEGLLEVRESLQRNLALNKPGAEHNQLERLAECIDKGLEEVKAEQEEVKAQVEEIQRVAATLDVKSGTLEQRKESYEQLQKGYEEKGGVIYGRLGKVMLAWAMGLFLQVEGKEGEKIPLDNLELERFFRNPKGHERRIHGHKHAGVRIVQEGSTLLHTLEAHLDHDGPYTAEDLLPYRHAQAPKDQQEAIHRRKIMRKARSKKTSRLARKIRNAV